MPLIIRLVEPLSRILGSIDYGDRCTVSIGKGEVELNRPTFWFCEYHHLWSNCVT